LGSSFVSYRKILGDVIIIVHVAKILFIKLLSSL